MNGEFWVDTDRQVEEVGTKVVVCRHHKPNGKDVEEVRSYESLMKVGDSEVKLRVSLNIEIPDCKLRGNSP